MANFEIVAHRGVPGEYPENTIPSFERAIELGADAVELDVRLTADKVPVVYHYYYMHMVTSLPGPIFKYTLEQLTSAKYTGPAKQGAGGYRISTLEQVLAAIGGRIGLEIEVKGPEPEAPEIIGSILNSWKSIWDSIEVTSFEPGVLHAVQKFCPGMITDLLFPRSESWMQLDVVAYSALHRARLAQARAIHLHPSQLNPQMMSEIREHGIEVHAWDINQPVDLESMAALGIPKFCTDELAQALAFREQLG